MKSLCVGLLLSLSMLFWAVPSHAEFLNISEEFRLPCFKPGILGFLKPNEVMPHRAKPILEQAPAGALVSVGSERGILTAVQSDQITHLIMVDHMPSICAYNNINFALIKLSEGDQDKYRYLRKNASFQEWIALKSRAHDLTDHEKKFLSSRELFNFFRSVVEKKVDAVNFEDPPTENFFSGDVHYLYNEKAFKRIYYLVANARVDSIFLDLGIAYDLLSLSSAMKIAKVPLSVLDISNAWMFNYLGDTKVSLLAKRVKNFFDLAPKAFVLGTGSAFTLPEGQVIMGERAKGSLFARYTAFTFDYLNTQKIAFSANAYDGRIDAEPLSAPPDVREVPSYVRRLAAKWFGLGEKSCENALKDKSK